jgi:ribosomal-protein-alanine N-acetyltransferase
MQDTDLAKVAQLDRENASSWAVLHFEQQLQAAHAFHFIAEQPETDELCGFICGQLVDSEAEIHKIAVAEKYRRQTIGTYLMHHTLQFLHTQQAQSCILELRRSNLPAKTLYQTFNFHQIAIRKKYYNSPKEDAMIMKLHLIST